MGAPHRGRHAPLHVRGVVFNYLGADAGGEAVQAAYGAAYTRLVALKDRYDPHNIFRLNQNIRPTRSIPS